MYHQKGESPSPVRWDGLVGVAARGQLRGDGGQHLLCSLFDDGVTGGVPEGGCVAQEGLVRVESRFARLIERDGHRMAKAIAGLAGAIADDDVDAVERRVEVVAAVHA